MARLSWWELLVRRGTPESVSISKINAQVHCTCWATNCHLLNPFFLNWATTLSPTPPLSPTLERCKLHIGLETVGSCPAANSLELCLTHPCHQHHRDSLWLETQAEDVGWLSLVENKRRWTEADVGDNWSERGAGKAFIPQANDRTNPDDSNYCLSSLESALEGTGSKCIVLSSLSYCTCRSITYRPKEVILSIHCPRWRAPPPTSRTFENLSVTQIL